MGMTYLKTAQSQGRSRRWLRRALGVAAACVAGGSAWLLLAGCEPQTKGASLRCVVHSGKIVQFPDGIVVRSQPPRGPGMAELAKSLARIARRPDAVTEAQGLVGWLRGRMVFGTDAFHYPLYTPAMLKRLEADPSTYTMTCGPASLLLTSMCLARGLEARVVSGYSLAGPELRSHTYVEVWDDDAPKWFVVDPSYGMTWVGPKGAPADALDLQDEYRRAGPDLRAFAYGPACPSGKLGVDCARAFWADYLPTYFDVIVQATANDFADPAFALRPSVFLGKFDGSLMYYAADPGRAAAHQGWAKMASEHGMVQTRHRDVWRWRPNQIELRVQERRPREVVLVLRHNIRGLRRMAWWQQGSHQRHAVEGGTLALPAHRPATFLLQGHTCLGGATGQFSVEIHRAESHRSQGAGNAERGPGVN